MGRVLFVHKINSFTQNKTLLEMERRNEAGWHFEKRSGDSTRTLRYAPASLL